MFTFAYNENLCLRRVIKHSVTSHSFIRTLNSLVLSHNLHYVTFAYCKYRNKLMLPDFGHAFCTLIVLFEKKQC